MRTIITTVSVIALGLTALVGLNSFSSINPGEKGVIVTLGKVVGEADPGIFFKTPFVTNVDTFSVRDQVKRFERLSAYTKDQQVATVPAVSVNYRIDSSRVTDLFQTYRTTDNMVEQLIGTKVAAELENAFGQYDAAKAVTDRAGLGQMFTQLIRKHTEGTPLVVTSVQIEQFSLPAEYEQNVNAQMAAVVKAKEAEETAKKTVTEAKALADSRLAVAKADAEATRLRGQAEADAIRARSEALKESPNLVALTAAERWDGVLPKTMLPNGSTPMLNLGAIVD